MKLTNKQKEILDLLIKGNPDGSWIDVDQLLERLSYDTTKPSIQYSIRILMGKGLMERREIVPRRGARRRLLAPTMKAYNILRDTT